MDYRDTDHIDLFAVERHARALRARVISEAFQSLRARLRDALRSGFHRPA